MIDGVTNAGAIPVLERMAQFASARHEVIAHNVANLSTPNFQPTDVSVEAFQAQLGEAIDHRREHAGAAGGELMIDDSSEVRIEGQRLELRPTTVGENILFHDHNDRDLERVMQDLAENFGTFRYATEMLRNRFNLIHTAIRGRL